MLHSNSYISNKNKVIIYYYSLCTKTISVFLELSLELIVVFDQQENKRNYFENHVIMEVFLQDKLSIALKLQLIFLGFFFVFCDNKENVLRFWTNKKQLEDVRKLWWAFSDILLTKKIH